MTASPRPRRRASKSTGPLYGENPASGSLERSATMKPVGPVVVALDVGSCSVRALAVAGQGAPLGPQCQRASDPETTPDGGVEIDADRLLTLTVEVVDGLVAALASRADAVAAVATSTFWHTLLGLGA